VTRFGVSVLNVVATMETPINHHGPACPEVKNSAVLDPARRPSSSAGMNEMVREAMMIAQSMPARCIWLSERVDCRQGAMEGSGRSAPVQADRGDSRGRMRRLDRQPQSARRHRGGEAVELAIADGGAIG